MKRIIESAQNGEFTLLDGVGSREGDKNLPSA